MKKFNFSFLAILLLVFFAFPAFATDTVQTYSSPTSGVKKFAIRSVTSDRTVGAIVKRDLSGNFETGAVLSAQYGAGALGTSDLGGPETYRRTENGTIITTILVDVTGLGCKGTAANDVIGLPGGGAAYLGRYTTAAYGIVYRVEMACVELPAGSGSATTDIDLMANASGTIEYDGAGGGVGDIFNTAGMVAGQELSNITPALTANDYFYLLEADAAATDGVYTAGQYIITFYGRALLD